MTNSPFDLPGYLARIGRADLAVAAPPALATLRALHLAHLAAIPFENLDVRLGRGVRLDLDSLQAKLVAGRRGGYCFEQNALFAAALRALGFEIATLEARVRPPGVAATLPRTHMVLRVTVEGRDWLADVGFGGDGPLYPVPLDGEESVQGPADVLAVVREDDSTRVLRRRAPAADGGWVDLYAFGLAPALPVDYEVANHYTSTWPGSPFVNTLTAQRTTEQARQQLRGRTYVERRGGTETRREMEDDEVVRLVIEEFGLAVAPEDVRRALPPR
jgi:N-hydroxyarylamine O-acetyltransferase